MELSSEHRERIHKKAKEFVKRWTRKYNIRESRESQTFINEFFGIFNIDRFASNIHFEYDLSKNENKKRIDVLWPGVILIENKSSGENLNRAFDQQVKEYFDMLKEKNHPKYVLVNNFHMFKLYNVKNGSLNESECFHISKLPDKVNLFYYFFDHKPQPIKSFKKVIHKNRYCILKLALASGLSFMLGYVISDGRPRKTLENSWVYRKLPLPFLSKVDQISRVSTRRGFQCFGLTCQSAEAENQPLTVIPAKVETHFHPSTHTSSSSLVSPDFIQNRGAINGIQHANQD